MNREIERLIYEANCGNSKAQVDLGIAYYKGEVTGYSDIEKCVYWCEKSAQFAKPEVQYELASIFKDIGLLNKAFSWYEKAAQRNHAKSQAALANFYFLGLSVPKDDNMAYYWAERAFADNKEYEESPLILGVLFLKGEIVNQNTDAAYKLFTVAANNGNETARDFRKQMKNEIQSVEKIFDDKKKLQNVFSRKTSEGLVFKSSSSSPVGRFEENRIYKGITSDLAGTYGGKYIYKGNTSDIIGRFENGYIYRGNTSEIAGWYDAGCVYKGHTSEMIGKYTNENEIPAIAVLLLL